MAKKTTTANNAETKKVATKKTTTKKVAAKKTKKVEAKKTDANEVVTNEATEAKKVAAKKTKKVEAKKADTKATKDKKDKFSLDTRVRLVAENEGGKGVKMPAWFNLPQRKIFRQLHIDICKSLAALSEANGNYPITYLVYFAVGKNAHRKEVFESGYNKFDEEKAKKIFAWLKLFAKYHNNDKLFRNPNVAHALCRFYDKFSTKTKDFKAAMELMPSNPKVNVKNAKAIVKGMGIAKQTEETELAAAEASMEPAVVTA